MARRNKSQDRVLNSCRHLFLLLLFPTRRLCNVVLQQEDVQVSGGPCECGIDNGARVIDVRLETNPHRTRQYMPPIESELVFRDWHRVNSDGQYRYHTSGPF
jgi:hypothetical protein